MTASGVRQQLRQLAGRQLEEASDQLDGFAEVEQLLQDQTPVQMDIKSVRAEALLQHDNHDELVDNCSTAMSGVRDIESASLSSYEWRSETQFM